MNCHPTVRKGFTEIGIPEIQKNGVMTHKWYCEEGFIETFFDLGDATREELQWQFRQYLRDDAFEKRFISLQPDSLLEYSENAS